MVYQVASASNYWSMKVSVIVPVYNIADCVSNCVESLLCQDYKEMEIILVDDGSMDDSPMVCDDWAKKDARIKVVHKSNGGLSSARNAGMDAACGEYVLFIDGDDYLANGTIASFVNVAEKSQTDVVQFGYEEVYGYGKVAEGVETKEQIDELTRMGCGIYQGYYFSKPIPVGQFEDTYL